MFNTKALKSKSSAFTLIELLVVIAIIAILAAILFPVFARARENARRSSCQSNLKQIGLGIFQYTQDYDEKLPFACDDANGAFPWQLTTQPYLKSTQIFKCPSNTAPVPSSDPASTKVSGSAVNGSIGIPVSYFCNGGGSYADATAGFGGVRPMERSAASNTFQSHGGAALAQLASTSQTILVLEHRDAGSNPDLYGIGDMSLANSPLQNHLTTTNFLFADGHVKSLKPLNTIAGGVNEWTVDPLNNAVPTTLQTTLGANQADMR